MSERTLKSRFKRWATDRSAARSRTNRETSETRRKNTSRAREPANVLREHPSTRAAFRVSFSLARFSVPARNVCKAHFLTAADDISPPPSPFVRRPRRSVFPSSLKICPTTRNAQNRYARSAYGRYHMIFVVYDLYVYIQY